MRHIRCCVKQSMDAVTTVALHHAVPMSLNMLLDNIANFTIPFAGLHNGNSLLQRLVRHLNQILMLFRHIPNEECLIQVAMKVAMINGHVNVAQFTILPNKKQISIFVTKYGTNIY